MAFIKIKEQLTINGIEASNGAYLNKSDFPEACLICDCVSPCFDIIIE